MYKFSFLLFLILIINFYEAKWTVDKLYNFPLIEIDIILLKLAH